MVTVLIYTLVYLGAALMVYNIIGFSRYAHYVKALQSRKENSALLHTPIVLLIMFLFGYLLVGIFGKPDLIVSGILFFGSVFVFIMYLLLFRITRRIVDNDRLKARLMAAEETNRVKSSFLAGFSHEMRTPMNVIIGLDNLALKDETLSPQTRSQLEKIGHSANHLLELINNILDLNRIETGKLTVQNEPFAMVSALEQVNAMTQSLCYEKGLDYRYVCEEEAVGWFEGDDRMLKQALIAVLENAVKYTEAPGEVRLTADVLHEKEKPGFKTLRFRVRDTGKGIDNEFLPHVFELFSQENTGATAEYGGNGMGLALTKQMMDMLGGEVSIQSEKEKGTEVTIVLPMAVCEEPKTPQEDVSDKSFETVSLAGRRALIVEDLPENAEIVADLLELEGMESDHAENGKIGVEMFAASKAGQYDVILMDLRMPVMDGLTATKAIRELDHPDAQRIPIIAVTANAFYTDVEQTLAAGMNEHLAKPTDAEILYGTIKKHIGVTERGKQA